jgi:hypothetical protein
MPQSHYTFAGIPACERMRAMRLKELPDLDQIKQAEQDALHWRVRFPKRRSGNPAGRP